MANDIPSGNTQFLINLDDQTDVLQATEARSATGTDPAIVVNGIHDRLILKGHTEQTDNANSVIRVNGEDAEVLVTKTGSTLGIGGIALVGNDAILNNAGSIESTGMNSNTVDSVSANASITNTGTIKASPVGEAILSRGDNSDIRNDGVLQGGNGIVINHAHTTIELGANSTITATGGAIVASNVDESDTTSIRNHGQITGQGGSLAIQFIGVTNDTVVNHGTITGEIFLGAGQDVFDNRGGTVDHAIEGFLGDDTLITDNAAVTLAENVHQGYDTVKSSVNYTLSANVERLALIGKGNINGIGTDDNNDLFGNSGKNQLSGAGGTDSLDGGIGNDLLTGGTGKDTFVFKTGYGHDTITDFSHAERDQIDVGDWTAIHDFQDIKTHSAVDHGNLVITVGQDQLTLENTSKADLHDSDFQFSF